MEQYFTWYILQLKAWIKKKSSWIMTAGILAVALLISQVQFPDADNTQVGICLSDDAYNKRIWDTLNSLDSVFVFQEYPEEKQLRKDIESGILECGFILPGELSGRVEEDQTKEVISYLCTPMTTKGEVVKETVYTAFLQVYTEQILDNSVSDMYGKYDPKIGEYLQEKYQDYLKESRLLKLTTEEIAAEYEQVKTHAGNTYPIHGLMGVLLTLLMWLEGGKRFFEGKYAVRKGLNIREYGIYRFCGNLAAATIPALAVFFFVLMYTQHRGIIKELLLLLLLLILSDIWVILMEKTVKDGSVLAATAFIIVVVPLIICPVFFDISMYIPALRLLRWFWPLAWYLL